MTIFGIGIDILKIDRINKMFLYPNNKFAQRILSEQELDDFKKKKIRYAF